MGELLRGQKRDFLAYFFSFGAGTKTICWSCKDLQNALFDFQIGPTVPISEKKYFFFIQMIFLTKIRGLLT